MDTLEEGYRALGTAEVADVDDKRHEVIVDLPHEILDSYRTDWGRGCFDDSLNQSLPPMVWNHDPSDLIGRARKWEPLGDKTRLISRFSDFDAVPRAKQAFAQVRDGDVPGFSFHYHDGRSIAHPSVRGARRFVKARMLEHSPVTFPTIPGFNAVGIRSEEHTLDVPTLEQILKLKEDGLTDEEGMRAMLTEFHPQLAEHIRVVSPPEVPEPLEAVKAVILESGVRSMVLHVDAEGGVSTDAANDASDLASAVDAALDTAQDLFDNMDVTVLPEPAQQAAALVNAAGVAVDELLDVMGIDDPDTGGRSEPVAVSEGESGVRAALTAEERNDLPDSAFAYVAPGGKKEDRHFPIHDAAHVRDALARIAQGAKFGDEAKPKVLAAAKKFGVEVGKRSEITEADLARVHDRLGIR